MTTHSRLSLFGNCALVSRPRHHLTRRPRLINFTAHRESLRQVEKNYGPIKAFRRLTLCMPKRRRWRPARFRESRAGMQQEGAKTRRYTDPRCSAGVRLGGAKPSRCLRCSVSRRCRFEPQPSQPSLARLAPVSVKRGASSASTWRHQIPFAGPARSMLPSRLRVFLLHPPDQSGRGTPRKSCRVGCG